MGGYRCKRNFLFLGVSTLLLLGLIDGDGWTFLSTEINATMLEVDAGKVNILVQKGVSDKKSHK